MRNAPALSVAAEPVVATVTTMAQVAQAMVLAGGRMWDHIGEYHLCSPPIPKDKSGFLNPKTDRQRDQFFQHTKLPSRDEYEAWDLTRQQAFEAQEWDRRNNGVWFWNNGVATWIPGQYYFFLNYHRFGDDKPEYRNSHRRLYWVWALFVIPQRNCLGLFLHTRRRWGKCLAPGTQVRMFDGSLRNVEDVHIGDQVMGVDSTPRNVVNTYSGLDEMYEIVQNKGMNYTVNSEHIVSLRRNKSTTCSVTWKGVKHTYQSYPQYGDVANVPTKELLGKSAKFFTQFSGYKVAVDYPSRDVCLDPYFLGAWLGDGTETRPAISTVDPELRDMVYDVAKAYGLGVRMDDSGGTRCPTYSITSGMRGGITTELAKAFNAYGLFGNKHIPNDYLVNDRETRLQVLAGIMDTDAHYAAGVFNVFQKRERIIDDTKALAESLGFRCVKSLVTKKIKSIGFEGKYFKLSVFGRVDTIPTRLPRKQAVCNKTKDPLLTKINEVRSVGIGRYYGFTIDGDNLFLLEDGTVTHNTSIAASIGLEAASGIRNFRVGVQSKTDDDAQELFLNEIQAPFIAMQDCPWFLPQTAGTSKPKSELLFDTPANRKKGAGNVPDKLRGLRSKIDFRESTDTAYDSQKLNYFINDEVGKKQRFDPWARHSIVSKQFYPNGVVIGKEFAMTTSDENDDDSVAMAKAFWDQSDPALLAKRKGLARLFFPDIEGFIVDKYGYDTAASIQDLNDERVAAEQAGVVDWIRRRRAYPRSISEAHLESVRPDCIFNQQHIGDCQTAIADHDATHAVPLVQRYKLSEDPATGQVYATPDAAGVFWMSWLPPASWLNKCKKIGTVTTKRGDVPRLKPESDHLFGVTADPFDARETENAGSKGALHAAFRFNLEMEGRIGEPGYWPSHSFFVEYAERPDNPDTYYEHAWLLCRWLGCSLFRETQKDNIGEYFIACGGQDFLAHAPVATLSEFQKKKTTKKTGAASSPLFIQQYTGAKTTFYQKYVGGPTSVDAPGGQPGVNSDGLPYDYRRMPFTRTMAQDIVFDPTNPTVRKKSDLSVSHGFGCVHITGFIIQPASGRKKGLSLKTVAKTRRMYR